MTDAERVVRLRSQLEGLWRNFVACRESLQEALSMVETVTKERDDTRAKLEELGEIAAVAITHWKKLGRPARGNRRNAEQAFRESRRRGRSVAESIEHAAEAGGYSATSYVYELMGKHDWKKPPKAPLR